MLQGLSTAAAGMAAQQQRIDAVSNDLANANTIGYKRVRVGFRDLVYQQAGRPAADGVQVGAGVAAVDAGRAFGQGSLRTTGRSLDVALSGEGFLRVRLPDGRAALSRDGALELDARNRLTTATGALVQPAITVPAGVSAEQLAIGEDGTVRVGEQVLGRLAVVTVRNPNGLLPTGDNAFVATDDSGRPTAAPTATKVVQGALEGSNVDMAEAMVGMIEAQRAFELTSKAITTADQMWEIANGVKR